VSIWVSLSAVTGRTSKASGSSVRDRFRSSGLTPGPSFLASISPDDLTDALDETLRGSATVDRRQQLHVEGQRVDCTGINDVMIEHEPPENPVDRKITELEVFADGEFVGEYEGSGLAVSTPTGSTGVSLSAGGPVHYPMNNSSLQIVPLHTHRMGTRPLIVDANTTIEVVSGAANLLVDGGRAQTRLEEGDAITISGADTSALVVNTSYDDDFFTSISEKLGWSVREDRHDQGDTDRVVSTTGAEDVVRRAKQVAEDASKAAGEGAQRTPRTDGVRRVQSPINRTSSPGRLQGGQHHHDRHRERFPTHGIRSEERRASRDEQVHLADRSARRHGEFRTWKPELLDLHRASGGRGTRNGRRLRAGDR